MQHATAERGACLTSFDGRTSLLEPRAPPMCLPSAEEGLGALTLASRTNGAEEIAEQMWSRSVADMSLHMM